MAGDKEQRTEKPTAKRKKELREKGTHARSTEIGTWAGAIVSVGMIGLTIRLSTAQLTSEFQQMQAVIVHPDLRKSMALAKESIISVVYIVGPLAMAMVAVGLAVNVAQVGFRPAAKLLAPKFSKINPLPGIKRMVSISTLWETAKAIIKVAFIFAVCWPAITGLVQGITMSGGSFTEITNLGAATAMQILRNVLIAGVVVSAADYIYQRRKYMGQARMTKQEVKEEYRQQEGDQMVRSARKSRMRSLSKNRIIAMAGSADVVLMNPTHYAVALKYDPEKGAPEIVAKGSGEVAMKIKAIALENTVPVVEDPPLARALFRLCEIGDFIPGDLYESVARILAFVFGLKRRGLGSGVQRIPGQETVLPPDLAEEDRRMLARRRPTRIVGTASAGGAVGPVSMD
jgi:flagellar biosynthetic protein FlhB